MTKTICDICKKEMTTSIITEPIRNYNFCISSYGKVWDLCNECREELNKWIEQKKADKEGD